MAAENPQDRAHTPNPYPALDDTGKVFIGWDALKQIRLDTAARIMQSNSVQNIVYATLAFGVYTNGEKITAMVALNLADELIRLVINSPFRYSDEQTFTDDFIRETAKPKEP